MNYSRKLDKLCHTLATSQARIFDRSVEEGLPSFFFIKSFMLSLEAKALDELCLEQSGINEVEIFESIKQKIKSHRGELLPYPVIHFIGYFYRATSYLTNITSKTLLEKIPPKFLVNNYSTLHSLPIESAIDEVFEINKIKVKTKEELFFDIYKNL